MKKQMQQGFTLIELMIVIAIIGILASIAIPQYQIYTQRAEVTTSIAAVRTVQLAIQEHYSTTGGLPATAAALAQFGVDDMNDFNNVGIIASVSVAAVTAAMTITYDSVANGAPADVAGKTLIITPTVANGIVTFTIAAAAPGDLDAKYRPNLPSS